MRAGAHPKARGGKALTLLPPRALYMNGVAQEMLRLVRATAPAAKDVYEAKRDLKGTELVYKKLGQMLRRGGKPFSLERVEADPASPITTRFIVDVISGTSAGASAAGCSSPTRRWAGSERTRSRRGPTLPGVSAALSSPAR
jgi:hypothetical protein